MALHIPPPTTPTHKCTRPNAQMRRLMPCAQPSDPVGRIELQLWKLQPGSHRNQCPLRATRSSNDRGGSAAAWRRCHAGPHDRAARVVAALGGI
eukprot:366265-Chlamydomonas_euryale.AAC.1